MRGRSARDAREEDAVVELSSTHVREKEDVERRRRSGERRRKRRQRGKRRSEGGGGGESSGRTSLAARENFSFACTHEKDEREREEREK